MFFIEESSVDALQVVKHALLKIQPSVEAAIEGLGFLVGVASGVPDSKHAHAD